MEYLLAYFLGTYILGFASLLIEARIRDGWVSKNDFNEALAESLVAFVWLPIVAVVGTLKLVRYSILKVFNIGSGR